MRRQCPGCDGYGEDVSMGETCEECDGVGSVAELTPREALIALGFRFEAVPRSRGKSVSVHAPRLPDGGGGAWRVVVSWPDSPEAARYVTETLLVEAERNAASARHRADIAARDADEAEAKAARLRDVAGRVRVGR